VQLPSLKNFRDLGGIPTSHGAIAPGRLFRTAHLSYLDEALAAHLAGSRGLRTYLDFRTDYEVTRDGAPKPLMALGVHWERRPFDIGDPLFLSVLLPEADDWSGLYARAFERLRPVFSEVVTSIASLPTPLVFGCWAGKDRTGMVAALLLSLLGVADDAIAADYALTSEGLMAFENEFGFLEREDPELRRKRFLSYCEAPPVVMHTFLAGLRARYGSVRTALDVNELTLQALQRSLLE
jgi:protein-tyrosine phosphatase